MGVTFVATTVDLSRDRPLEPCRNGASIINSPLKIFDLQGYFLTNLSSATAISSSLS